MGHAVLFVAARDSDGGQSDLIRQVHEIRIPAKELEAAANKEWTINARLLMESGKYRLSVGLMDQVSNEASYTQSSTFIRDTTVKD